MGPDALGPAGTGTLTLSTPAGLTGTGDGTAIFHYRGGLAELNTALDGLRISPAPGFHGKIILTISAGSPGALRFKPHVRFPMASSR